MADSILRVEDKDTGLPTGELWKATDPNSGVEGLVRTYRDTPCDRSCPSPCANRGFEFNYPQAYIDIQLDNFEAQYVNNGCCLYRTGSRKYVGPVSVAEGIYRVPISFQNGNLAKYILGGVSGVGQAFPSGGSISKTEYTDQSCTADPEVNTATHMEIQMEIRNDTANCVLRSILFIGADAEGEVSSGVINGDAFGDFDLGVTHTVTLSNFPCTGYLKKFSFTVVGWGD